MKPEDPALQAHIGVEAAREYRRLVALPADQLCWCTPGYAADVAADGLYYCDGCARLMLTASLGAVLDRTEDRP